MIQRPQRPVPPHDAGFDVLARYWMQRAEDAEEAEMTLQSALMARAISMSENVVAIIETSRELIAAIDRVNKSAECFAFESPAETALRKALDAFDFALSNPQQGGVAMAEEQDVTTAADESKSEESTDDEAEKSAE